MTAVERIGADQTQTVYVFADRLSSANLVTNTQGEKIADQRCLPFGEERWNAVDLPNDRSYTGQRNEPGFGLLDYNARFYSAYLGRFVSADTLVPYPADAKAFDRYAYVNNNPMNFTDPSGHSACWDENASDPGCLKYDSGESVTKPVSKNQSPDPIGTTIIVINGASTIISGVEAALTDGVGLGIMLIGCGGASPETLGLSCGISAKIAWEVDKYLASPGSGIGLAENLLGYLSLGLTWWSDKNNTWEFNENGKLSSISIGKDTAITARNTLLGLIPEANTDAAISFSQFKYDLDRLYGEKPGGAIILYDSSVGFPSIKDGLWNLFQYGFLRDWW
ncbi:MAG TPA: RHS repeat-associated core domain-containing protein [Anaerolineaceae bacterium]